MTCVRGAVAVMLTLSGAAMADPKFEDHSDAFPVEHVYSGGWEHFVGGGVAVFDCNEDSLPDVYVAGGEAPARLFVNTTPATGGAVDFTQGNRIPSIQGATGAYPIDINGDGYVDLAVLRVGENRLLMGDGTCAFTDGNEDWRFQSGDHWTTAFSATWEAGQNWPTLAFGNYVDRFDPEGPFERCDVNTLYRPDTDGYGTPTRLEPGFCALSMLFSDWQRSGTAELRISNDRHYYVQGGYEQMWQLSPLRERGEEDGWNRISIWGMGIASADLGRDSYPDVMLTSMGDQVLLMNAEGQLTPAPFDLGATAHRPHVGDDGRPSTGWHAEFGDIDNDGQSDLFIAKGNVDQMPSNAINDPNNLLMQLDDGKFIERSVEAGVATTARSRGAGLADMNGDGLLDILVVNRRAAMELWLNVTADSGNWAKMDIRMDGPNTFAIGAWLEIETENGTEWRERTIGGGHVSGQLLPFHIGMGAAKEARIRVWWPDGTASEWQIIRAGTNTVVTRP